MNKFEYKNLTPFKWFVLENFPFIEADFDALTEWQLFCKIGKEINKIIDSQNVVGTEMEKFSQAFIELKNYVDNYFENLDVQDEINNKLNKMVEDGTLPEIVVKYLDSKAIFGFDNVEEMKNDTNLKAGMFVETYGYYEPNDGGAGKYYIVNETNNYYEILKNNLKAELITENASINVKQFGAKGDNIKDDTDSIQNAIDYAFKKNKDATVIGFNNPIVILPSGRYKITSQIDYPVTVKLEPIGDVYILSNYKDGSTLYINSRKTNMYDYIQPVSMYDGTALKSGIINSSNGTLTIQFVSENEIEEEKYNTNGKSIGIEIGDVENLPDNTYKRISRTLLKNIVVSCFNVGLKINTNNFYMFAFENMTFQRNKYGILVEPLGNEKNNVNSGENITFYNCIFTMNLTAFRCNSYNMEFTFRQCSFDFNNCVIHNNSKYNNYYYMFGGHIEAIGSNTIEIPEEKENITGYGSIFYNEVQDYANVVITLSMFGVNIYNRTSYDYSYKFYSTKINNNDNVYHLNVSIYNTYFISKTTDTFINGFICNPNVLIKHFDSLNSNNLPYLYQYDDIGTLKMIKQTETITQTELSYYGYDIVNKNGTIESINVVNQSPISNKSVKINYTNQDFIEITRSFKDNSATSNRIMYNLYFNPENITSNGDEIKNYKVTLYLNCYSSDNHLINTPVYNASVVLKDKNSNWYRTQIFANDIPLGVDHVKIIADIKPVNSSNQSVNTTGSIQFGGIIVNSVY